MDYLYGKLNKEVEYVQYKGGNTETATTSIANDNTISVDVLKVPNKLTIIDVNGNSAYYDGSSAKTFDISTQIDETPTDGSKKAVQSGGVKLYIDGKVLDIDDQIAEVNEQLNEMHTSIMQLSSDKADITYVDKLVNDLSADTEAKITALDTEVKRLDSEKSDITYVDDTFVKKVTTTGIDRAYIVDSTGEQGMVGIDMNPVAYRLAKRGDGGTLKVGTPAIDTDATTKQYVDSAIQSEQERANAYADTKVSKVTSTAQNNRAYTVTADGEQTVTPISVAEERGTIAIRGTDGKLNVGTPTGNNNATTKKYVDEADSAEKTRAESTYLKMAEKALTTDDVSLYAVVPEQAGESALDRQILIDASEYETGRTIAKRSGDGRLRATDPSDNLDVANKKYVDERDGYKLDVAGGAITGNLKILGDLTVTGTTTTEKAETLAVKDSTIITNADGAELGATLSGIAIRKDATDTYGIMYDPSSDSVKLGLGALDSDNKFTFNNSGTDGKAVATRADSKNMTDGNLVKWDSATNSLVDSGKSTNNFVEKQTAVTKSLYGVDSQKNQINMLYTEKATAWTVAQRKANGTLTVGAPTEDTDATTKKYVDDNLATKQDMLSFDESPTAESNNPVYSKGIKTYVDDGFIPKSTFTNAWQVLVTGADKDTITARSMSNTPANQNMVNFDTAGRLRCNNPNGTVASTDKNYVVNQEYAEANFVPNLHGNTNVIGYDDGGNYTTYVLGGPTPDAIAVYNKDMPTLSVITDGDEPSDDLSNLDAVSRYYAHKNFVPKTTEVPTDTDLLVYAVDKNGNQITRLATASLSNLNKTIVLRDSLGHVNVSTPTYINHATTKQYVDTAITTVNTITITEGA